MNFIKIKDDYINLNNVADIRIFKHGVMFVFVSPAGNAWICYKDSKVKSKYHNRELTTEELEQLKYQLDGLI